MKQYIKYLYLIPIVLAYFSCNDSDVTVDIPSGSYHYRSYNSSGEKIVEGWFTMEEDSVSNITGEWHFDKIGNPKDIGPQVGDGVLLGGYNDDTLWVELNPQYKDNNLQLIGTLKDGCYEGRWIWITFRGVTAEGTFKANYKE